MSIFSGGIVRNSPPTDGLWRGGKNLGEPVSYQTWGWARDLVDVPEFQFDDMVGITDAQARAGFSFSGGALLWNSRHAVNAGASAEHSLRVFLPEPFTTFKNEGFQMQSNMALSSDIHAIDNTYMRTGVEVIDAEGAPVLYPGRTSNRLHEGYTQHTYSSSGRGFSHFSPETLSTLGGAAYDRGFQFAVYPQTEVYNNGSAPLVCPMFTVVPTNSSQSQHTPDFRPIGYDGSGDHWRPFIEIKARLTSPTIRFSFRVPVMIVSGIPKT